MMKKKKNSDVYNGEMEVENYHTLCVLITFMKIVKIMKHNSLEQGTLSWKNLQYQWEGEERFTDMSQDESLVQIEA